MTDTESTPTPLGHHPRTRSQPEGKKVTFSDTADYLLGVKIEQGIDKNGMRFVELDHAARGRRKHRRKQPHGAGADNFARNEIEPGLRRNPSTFRRCFAEPRHLLKRMLPSATSVAPLALGLCAHLAAR